MSEVKDTNIDWLKEDPTDVTKTFDSITPIIDATKLPGYEIGFEHGKQETRIQDWIEGVTQALATFKWWLEKQNVPHADHIVGALRNEIFRKPK
jgi:hypothetical protein